MSTDRIRWSVQSGRRRGGWSQEEAGTAALPEAHARDIALAVLAAHLMAVDHDADLDDRRAMVTVPDGIAQRVLSVVTEDDLERHLRESGYYPGRREAAPHFPSKVVAALPLDLRDELYRVGAPGYS
ncbi:hypothetical protein [Streptomyces lydicus]|uniref:hypothetical protein n=1 Tax=Streptomyces lydicus TaxID=47763 RepID=UPI0010124079|nr:hypothetical protein [Streptomyces lydicus]MCZ1012266.1 hypothetical protein [Streptomyces lydicus]